MVHDTTGATTDQAPMEDHGPIYRVAIHGPPDNNSKYFHNIWIRFKSLTMHSLLDSNIFWIHLNTLNHPPPLFSMKHRLHTSKPPTSSMYSVWIIDYFECTHLFCIRRTTQELQGVSRTCHCTRPEVRSWVGRLWKPGSTAGRPKGRLPCSVPRNPWPLGRMEPTPPIDSRGHALGCPTVNQKQNYVLYKPRIGQGWTQSSHWTGEGVANAPQATPSNKISERHLVYMTHLTAAIQLQIRV